MINIIPINAYGGNWLHILLKMTGSFGCVVTSGRYYTTLFGRPNSGTPLTYSLCSNTYPLVLM